MADPQSAGKSGKPRWTWRDWAPIFAAVLVSSVFGAIFDWSVWITLLVALVVVVVLSALAYRGVDVEGRGEPRR